MNFNKKKFKFTDLSDDNTFENSPKQNDSLQNNTDLDLDFNFSNKGILHRNENINQNNHDVIPIYKKDNSVNNFQNDNNNVNNIEMINQSEVISMVDKAVNTHEESKNYLKNDLLEESKKSSQEFKTFNQIINNVDNKNESNLNNDKISNNFNVKEKLDVKTNIYLKQNLVFQIQEISKKTGESRSSVINRLIEIALKEMV